MLLGAALLQERLERPAWHVVAGTAALGVALISAVVIATAQKDQSPAPFRGAESVPAG